MAIVDHDTSHAHLLDHSLRLAGHRCHRFDRGDALICALRQQSFDAFVLEWDLPDISGVELLECIRESPQSSASILFASTRDCESDVVTGFQQGADAYMVKPIRSRELIARLEAIARRRTQGARQPEVLSLGVYQIDYEERTVLRHGDAVEMAPKDFDLSVLFLRNVGRLLSRGDICGRVWGRKSAVSSRSLDTHVSRICNKLGFTPALGWRLAAVYGYGYRLERLATASRRQKPASSQSIA